MVDDQVVDSRYLAKIDANTIQMVRIEQPNAMLTDLYGASARDGMIEFTSKRDK